MSEADKAIWFGKNAPEKFTCLSTHFINNPDTRLSSEHYSKYSEVVFTEAPISNYGNWPFIIDELFKLSKGKTTFKIRFRVSSPVFSTPKFYKQIHNLSAGSVEFVSLERAEKNDGFIVTFTATRRRFDVGRNWSFGILWDGKNEEYLRSYVDSVANLANSGALTEIIICGPRPTFEIALDHTIVEADNDTEKYANISRKKNIIISQAKFENICIAHNRYKLDANFIKAFDRINHDFDICVVKQILNDTGERVPDWVSQASDQRLTANYLLNYGEYSPYLYVPGGLVIGKKHVLTAFPFNDLGTWNMAEDVELSQRLMSADYLPRLNTKTIARVLQLRKEIIADFKKPDLNNFYHHIDLFQGPHARVDRYWAFLKRNVKLLLSDPLSLYSTIKNRLKNRAG